MCVRISRTDHLILNNQPGKFILGKDYSISQQVLIAYSSSSMGGTYEFSPDDFGISLLLVCKSSFVGVSTVVGDPVVSGSLYFD